MRVSQSHSPNLDLLRAIAVSMVVATHLLEINGHLQPVVVRLGHAGVMMFFVHTALVLMQSLERLDAEDSRLLALRFYVRRVFRIYPLPIFMVLLVATVAKIYPHALNAFFATYHPTPSQLFANLTLTQNLFRVQDILIVMWSLPPEVQMYAALPVFFLFRKSLPTSMLMLWAGWVIALTFIEGTRAFELLQYLPMFLPGIIAFQYLGFVKPAFPGWLWPIAMGLPIAGFVLFPLNATILSWVACLGLGLLIPHFKPLQSRAVRASAETIARYSYGIYLAHAPCIFVSFALLASYALTVRLAAFAVLLCGSSFILYRVLERPLLSYGVVLARRLQSRPLTEAAYG